MFNILPYDGEANYYGPIFPPLKSKELEKILLETVPWENDRIFIYGREIITKRKIAWLGTKPFEYRYSKNTKKALPFSQVVEEIKSYVEELTKESFNSCLLNLYHSGDESMGWHRDNEPELKKQGAIASLSFGANRIFQFKHIETKEKIDIELESGSLLMMKGIIQDHWYHQLPKRLRVQESRINLTFRTIIQ